MGRFEMKVNDGKKITAFVYEDEDEASPVVIALVETFEEAVKTKYFLPFYRLLEEVSGEKWQNVSISLSE
jgi:hypothetical protein